MSADLVDPEHIHVLIHAGLPRLGHVLRWQTTDPSEPTTSNGIGQVPGYRYRELRPATADRVGQILTDANATSLNTLYQRDDAYIYSYTRPTHTTWSPIEILCALDGYAYQACETHGWTDSEAYAFCDALRHAIIRRLPDYDRAPTWMITTDSVPLAVTRAQLARTRREDTR